MKIRLEIGDQIASGYLDDENEIANIISKKLPLIQKINRYGDEIYFLVKMNIAYHNNDINTFEIGDIIYWKSRKSEKEAVAVFFGPTPIEDGSRPRAPSDAIRIGKISTNGIDINLLETGLTGKLLLG